MLLFMMVTAESVQSNDLNFLRDLSSRCVALAMQSCDIWWPTTLPLPEPHSILADSFFFFKQCIILCCKWQEFLPASYGSMLLFCWGLPYSLPKGGTFVNSDALTTVEFPWSHGLSSRTAYTAVTADMLQSPSPLWTQIRRSTFQVIW